MGAQAQQPAFQFLILLPAQRGFAAQPFVVPAAGDLQQSAYKFHRGPRAGRTDVPVLVLYGLESMPTDFFRMSMTPSFSSSFLRSARISVSSSRRRLASRFWRSACPGDGAPAAFSQLRSVSMQMPSSAATVPFPVSWTVKMKKKQKETQDILSYHTQAAGCSDKARAKASGGRQPIEECGRTGL